VYQVSASGSPLQWKDQAARQRYSYIQWTRTVNGKTRTRFFSEEQLARYQPWFDNTRRIKDLLAKLEIASVAALEQAEGWPTPTNDTGP
jgi:hypothetical protein